MFESWIQEIRDRFSRLVAPWRILAGRRHGLIGMLSRERLDPLLRPLFIELAEHGKVVWGAIVQANDEIFTNGIEDHPANIVYGIDRYFDSHAHHLAKIATGIYRLKGVYPENPSLAKVAAVVTDEQNYVANWRLPYRISDGHEVFVTSILLQRSRLVRGMLDRSILPIVVAPERIDACMLVPTRCWPKNYLRGLVALEAAIQEQPTVRKRDVSPEQHEADEHDAQQRPHRPPIPEDLVPGASRFAVSLTKSCADAVRRIAVASRLGPNYHLRISGNLPSCRLDIVDSAIANDDVVIESQGVRVAIQRSTSIRAAVIDFRNLPIPGFVIVEP